MKREDLKALGLTDEQIEKVMAVNGADIEAQKTRTTQAETEAKTTKDQLAEANKQIDAFKGMDIEGVKKTAEEYKTKFENAQAESAKELAQVKFEHSLEGALAAAKAKNPKAVKALLDLTNLKLNEADGSIIGLKDQLEKVQKENDYLFDSETPTPTIITGGNNKPVSLDAVAEAARVAAGLPSTKEK